jgi:hypothetical protein
VSWFNIGGYHRGIMGQNAQQIQCDAQDCLPWRSP